MGRVNPINLARCAIYGTPSRLNGFYSGFPGDSSCFLEALLLRGRRLGALARGGRVPPRVLRDYCRKTLTSLSLPRTPAAPHPAAARGCRGGCTSDRFQPGIVAIVGHWFSKPAGRSDLTLGELASGRVKSVIRATTVESEVYRDPANPRTALVNPPPHRPCDL